MRTCPSCGRQAAEEDVFCRGCGSRLPAAQGADEVQHHEAPGAGPSGAGPSAAVPPAPSAYAPAQVPGPQPGTPQPTVSAPGPGAGGRPAGGRGRNRGLLIVGIVVIVVIAAFLAFVAYTVSEGGPSARPKTVTVKPDAAQDYGPLSDAIRRVAEGGTVQLGAGTYDLGDRQLVITRSVRLVGAGPEETEVVGSAKESALVVRAADFSAEGISFVKSGSTNGGALAVTHGTLQMTRCRFTGSSGDKQWSYASLWIKGDAQATVRECTADDGDSGIDASGDSSVTMESTQCNSNRVSGVAVYGNAEAIMRSCTCAGNADYGVTVSEHARVKIQGGRFSNNKTGVWIEHGKSARIERCKFNSNQRRGVMVAGGTNVVILESTFVGNGNGIEVFGGQRVALLTNRCERNRETGITVAGGDHVRVEWNRCNRNGDRHTGGICVNRRGHPRLLNNTCNNNLGYGILFRDRASGEARENYCSRNRWGIIINDRAHPKLRGNDCEFNSKGNIETYRGG